MTAKISTAHQTYSTESMKIREKLKPMPGLKLISSGRIAQTSSAPKVRVKISDIQGGLLLAVRGKNTVHEVRIYGTMQQEAVEASIKELGYDVTHR